VLTRCVVAIFWRMWCRVVVWRICGGSSGYGGVGVWWGAVVVQVCDTVVTV
jgi:hypothetical protein